MVVLCAFAYGVEPGNADDAKAIQTAIDAAAAPGGSGRVTLMDGTYHLSSPVIVSGAVELVGNDGDRSRVIFDGAGKYRLIEVAHNSAFVHGITFADSYSDKTSNWYYARSISPPVSSPTASIMANVEGTREYSASGLHQPTRRRT